MKPTCRSNHYSFKIVQANPLQLLQVLIKAGKTAAVHWWQGEGLLSLANIKSVCLLRFVCHKVCLLIVCFPNFIVAHFAACSSCAFPRLLLVRGMIALQREERSIVTGFQLFWVATVLTGRLAPMSMPPENDARKPMLM